MKPKLEWAPLFREAAEFVGADYDSGHPLPCCVAIAMSTNNARDYSTDPLRFFEFLFHEPMQKLGMLWWPPEEGNPRLMALLLAAEICETEI